jgi:hypothetical protein
MTRRISTLSAAVVLTLLAGAALGEVATSPTDARPTADAQDPSAGKGDKDKKGQGKKNPAAESYSVEVLVLHATNSRKGIDERIGNMPELKKPPFSAYDSYELLSKTSLPLKKDDPKTIKLPNGRMLQTKLLEILPKDTVRISASINQPKGRDFLPLLEVKATVGQSFIVAGQSYKSGILVLVLRVIR